MDFFGRSKVTPEPDRTTKTTESAKVSYAESPQLYIYEQFKLATDRISVVRDVQKLVKHDLRFTMTNLRLAADAARGGFKVVVHGSETYRQARRKKGKSVLKRLTPGANIAQQVIDDLLTRTKLQAKAKGYTRGLVRDGDLFLNPLVDLAAGLILDVRQGPVLTIKRNNDEYGEFPDPEKAFSQIDPKTQIHTLMEIGPPSEARGHFALFQMNHIRWLCEETENYGTSHYKSARAIFSILQRMERATAIRREFRSVKKRSHKLPDNTGETQVVEYMRNVGLVDKDGNPTKNAHLLSDFVGTAQVTALNDTTNLSEMDDVKYFEELLWLNLSVPKAVLTAGADINRDVLKVQYPHYLQTLEDITDVLEYGDPGPFSGLRAIIDLQLLLTGINPDAISYDIVWSDKTDETPNERMDRVQKALGANKGVKVITRLKAIQASANDFDIEDPEEMARLVEEEEARDRAVMAAAKPNIARDKLKPGEDPEEEESEDNLVTDVLLEDRPVMEAIEQKAQATVLRFFRAVYTRMLKYSGDVSVTDEVNEFSEDSIITVLEDAWDEKESKYQVGITNQMTEAAVIGAVRALQLVEAKSSSGGQGGSGDVPPGTSGVKIKPRIVKSDIRDDLFNESGKRIKGIKDTTLKQIRGALTEGFEQDLGWKNIMKQLQPIIVNEVRAEMIARTELSWAYNRSAKRIYRDAGFARVEWSAVLDQRTCPICRGRNGETYPIDNHPDCPAHPRCYDKETEVYTDRGWIKFSKLIGDEKFLSLNPETHQPEWTSSVKNISYSYEGDMISLKSNSLDMMVTPNHQMYIGERKGAKRKLRWGLVDAGKLMDLSEFYVNKVCNWSGEYLRHIDINGLQIPVDIFTKFMGYYLSEGSTVKRGENAYQISITQEKTDNYKKIYNDIKDMPVKVNRGQGKFYINSVPLGKYLEQMGQQHVRYVPEEIKKLPREQLNLFLDAYVLGDGNIKVTSWKEKEFKSIGRKIDTYSTLMASDLGEVILKAGFYPSFTLRKTKGKQQVFSNGTYTINHDIWVIYINNKKCSIYQRGRKNGVKILNKYYDDKVYCVELEKNHILWVRRNGKAAWCGNCRCSLLPVD